MLTILCIVIFVGLTFWLYRFPMRGDTIVKLPNDKSKILICDGYESAIVAMYATAWIGLAPILSLRLATLEFLCLILILKCNNKQPFSFPLKVYALFLVYVAIGMYYNTSFVFGFRMVLKYLYPFLFAMACAKIARDRDLLLACGLWGRLIGIIGIVLLVIPFIKQIVSPFLWFSAGYTTGLIPYMVFSLALAFHAKEKKRNILWTIAFALPCVLQVYRTDILGTGVALAAFCLIKFKLKSIPFIIVTILLGLSAIFYIPQVKEKMFLDPDKVEMEDYLNGNIDEDNIQTNYRKFAWEDIQKRLEEPGTFGNGTGRVQTWYYTEVTGIRRGGQLHNDYLVLYLDNGILGLILFIGSYIAIFGHCLYVYNSNRDPYIRIAAITAGSSVLGVAATMYTDNTVSYSMVTLAAAWGFYGIMLGLKYRQKLDWG